MTKLDRLEYFRQRYAALNLNWESATALYQRWVAELIGPGWRILDLGCGRGGIVERLVHKGHWVGLDPDYLSLRQHRLPALPRTCARSDRLPFCGDTFDMVVASWVLEHLPVPQATFREVARVLRPGGVFIFLTPNAAHPIPRLSMAFRVLERGQRWLVTKVYGRSPNDTFPVTYQANTVRQVEQLAARAGFRLRKLALIADPSYFAWNHPTFIAAVALEWLLPVMWKVHLVGFWERQ